jgi:hypothetical protein
MFEVIMKICDERIIRVMEKRPEEFNLRKVEGGVIVYLKAVKDSLYEIPPLLCEEEFWVNVNEGKDRNGLVTVVCSLSGGLIKPFWVKGRNNQREIDKEVDVRFSLYKPACLITVNQRGLLAIYKLSVEDHFTQVEVKLLEIHSSILKMNKGKFFFNEKSLEGRKYLLCFLEAIKVAVKKANASDGGGPMYFLPKSPIVIFHEEQSPMAIAQKGGGKIVLSSGVTISHF